MPVIVLEARDFTSPLFLVRTLEVFSSCTAFSLVASLDHKNSNSSSYPSSDTFRIFCMFTWCFFFVITLLIHIISIIQFHSLIPISWKNLTMTVALLGVLMNLSSTVVFPWIVMDHGTVSPRALAATVASGFTFMAYVSESCVLRSQAHEQRGYIGTLPGFLKIIQLWGGLKMVPLMVIISNFTTGVLWQFWISCVSYGICIFISLVILVVILGDFAGRCLLPFDRFLAAFSLIGVLLYMLATVICLTKILQLSETESNPNNLNVLIMETVVSSATLLAYTVDLAFSIKLLCDRSHI
ncbi:myeloid-associated differentiation marker-like [Xiphophorus couchianus]|uniref:myeloid-associated differentiation marker-like n=1 Tax=Xiphophorus couchianus TaxID=32473 RepID=UPI0010167F04|nr:myeloid-associated differentiation marker-like [Xiphophorus couchianus]